MNQMEIEVLTKSVVETLEMYKSLVKNNINKWSESEKKTALYHLAELELFAVTMITFENDFKQRKELNLNKILTRLRIVKMEDDNKSLKSKEFEKHIENLKEQQKNMVPNKQETLLIFSFIETLVNSIKKEFNKDREETVH